MKILKKILVLSVTTIGLSLNIFAAGKLPETASDSKISIYMNNVVKTIPNEMGSAYFDKSNNRVMVPIRFISEELGAYINFYQEKEGGRGILIGGVGSKLIKMNIGSNEANLLENDSSKIVKTDAQAILYDGRTYVPVRFISEAMGLTVDWKDNVVYITGSIKDAKDSNENSKNLKEENKSEEKKLEENKLEDRKIDQEKMRKGLIFE
ncbi:copper amine oxidase N-terminal domain-containing protein [Peptoniphilus raoultii]|uniref:copper amine oxidase N-terminal domain-containing protein n=1 Tax=Peptoniphilus raoultii TaxID=1776387 RepID=UPI0008DB128C|nr:copper amine oxidase N-terminal domain-containing protein [Peptoniphilus raoultii]